MSEPTDGEQTRAQRLAAAMRAASEQEQEALVKTFGDFAANSARIESGTYAPTPEDA